jgi:hypothetical protein
MNNEGKCVNSKCSRFGIVETYGGMLLAGLGAGKDRARCPECGELLQVTGKINTGGRRHVRSFTHPRKAQRGHGRGESGR